MQHKTSVSDKDFISIARVVEHQDLRGWMPWDALLATKSRSLHGKASYHVSRLVDLLRGQTPTSASG